MLQTERVEGRLPEGAFRHAGEAELREDVVPSGSLRPRSNGRHRDRRGLFAHLLAKVATGRLDAQESP